MMDMFRVIVTVLISYLIGSIPTAFIFGKVLKGVDIRQHGSGNVGATNAFRVLGKIPGTVVLILDIVKGIIPVVLVAGYLKPDELGRVLAAAGAVCGHNWTCFLRFKGGKGIATSLGVLIGLMAAIPEVRLPVALCVGTWIITFLVTSYVSASSILAAVVLPIFMVLCGVSTLVTFLSITFCIFVVFRHKTNIHRLLTGQEPKVPLPFRRPSRV